MYTRLLFDEEAAKAGKRTPPVCVKGTLFGLQTAATAGKASLLCTVLLVALITVTQTVTCPALGVFGCRLAT